MRPTGPAEAGFNAWTISFYQHSPKVSALDLDGFHSSIDRTNLGFLSIYSTAMVEYE
jgi:hypothetical protein